MLNFHIVWMWLRIGVSRFSTGLVVLLTPSRTPKILLSFETSSKSEPVRKGGSKTISQGLIDCSHIAFPLWRALKRAPQSDPHTMVWPRNTVNIGYVPNLLILSCNLLFSISWSKFEYLCLKACVVAAFSKVSRVPWTSKSFDFVTDIV